MTVYIWATRHVCMGATRHGNAYVFVYKMMCVCVVMRVYTTHVTVHTWATRYLRASRRVIVYAWEQRDTSLSHSSYTHFTNDYMSRLDYFVWSKLNACTLNVCWMRVAWITTCHGSNVACSHWKYTHSSYTKDRGDRTSNNKVCQNFRYVFTGVPVNSNHVFKGVNVNGIFCHSKENTGRLNNPMIHIF